VGDKKKIALGISSSISIYKSCEIIRGFQKKGYDVHVILTKNASRLISPLLFSALTGNKVRVDPFEEDSSKKIAHVSLSQKISLFVVAPATANIIGKFASGIADDFLSTFYLTVECPVLIAPAMNDAMYLHKQTQKNIKKLKEAGVKFVEPEKGYLACKEEGLGRLADPDDIIKAGEKLLKKSRTLKGKTLLVTAGPTREYLDPVRFLSNRSSGKMGFELAEEAFRRGADVILISGPTNLVPPRSVKFRSIQTAGDMEKEVLDCFGKADIIIMAAAVSDIKFAAESSHKVKKHDLSEDLKIRRTTDILGTLGRKKGKKILVGFAAETENVEKNARKKMEQKNLDLIVANDVSGEGIGFDSDSNRVYMISPDGKGIDSGKKSKHRISEMIFDKIEGIIGEKS
jgi:phosphopantothenoylcysteine decarboxylase/phosphopantothenate--cysteine ligase